MEEKNERIKTLTKRLISFHENSALIVVLVILCETGRIKANKSARYLCTAITALVLHLLVWCPISIGMVLSIQIYGGGGSYDPSLHLCRGGKGEAELLSKRGSHSNDSFYPRFGSPSIDFFYPGFGSPSPFDPECKSQYEGIVRLQFAGYAFFFLSA